MHKLVLPKDIPLAVDVEETPEGIIKAYKTAVGMSIVCVKNGGIGLSAVQVGVPMNLFIVKNNLESENYNQGFRFFVNAKYEPVGDEKYESLEGCLSLVNPDGTLRYFTVPRPSKIRFVGKEIIAKEPLSLKEVDLIIDKPHCSVYAHETDHAYGVTIDKIGSEHGLVKVKRKK